MGSKYIAGQRDPSRGRYKHVPLEEILGKTVEAIKESVEEGQYGKETMIILSFTDGTYHGFVLQKEEP